MAGAITAGAYIAGVVDFLVEALTEWEKAKKHSDATFENVLLHEVQIKTITGASAGGLTAAIIASGLLGNFKPVRNVTLDDNTPTGNTFYDSWVIEPKLSDLLQLNDLLPQNPNPTVRSLADCTWLTTLLGKYVTPPEGVPSIQKKPFLTDPLHLFLSVANMRGVPYTIPFTGVGAGHEMMRHEDYFQFSLGTNKPDPDSALCEDPLRLDPTQPGSPQWAFLRQAAQASSAIPMVLLNQVLDRKHADYNQRMWDVVRNAQFQPDAAPSASDECPRPGHVNAEIHEEPISPDWRNWEPKCEGMDPYTAMYMDGGTFNNEPFELARKSLAGADKLNPRDAAHARRAVLMIDPFPGLDRDDAKTVQGYPKKDIIWQLGRLMGAWKSQSRFKPGEIVLAQDENVYSRFLITPQRKEITPPAAECDDTPKPSPIATGSLGGFGGFLSLKFRQHDFMLGRRNCQRFLQQHFVIPLDSAIKNNVFGLNINALAALQAASGGNASNLSALAKQNPNWNNLVLQITGKTGNELVVPIIPLCGSAKTPNTMDDTPWNLLAYDMNGLEPLLELGLKRVKRIVSLYLGKFIPGWLQWIAKCLLSIFAYGKLEAMARDVVAEDLAKNGLLQSPPPARPGQ